MTLKTRKPTGAIPPPVVLVEGDEGAGKSFVTAELSASKKVSRTLWMELGKESTADQYGAIPGVRYEIVQPDVPAGADVWDWHTLYQAARDIHAEGVRAKDAGELPVVWAVDVVGAVWDMLSGWADNRARSSKENAKKLAEDPNYEYVIGHNYWNAATERWQKFMTLVLTFPGIVVLLSRGQEVTLFEGGKPTNRKTWKVEGQKGLTFDVPIWVRMTRGGNPTLVKFRSVTDGLKAGDRPRPLPSFSLEKLIFETLGWDPTASGYRVLTPMVAGSEAPVSEYALVLETAIETADGVDQLARAYARIKPALDGQQISEEEAVRLGQFARRRKAEMEPGERRPAETNGRIPAIVGAAA
jgi:hypothetical protein